MEFLVLCSVFSLSWRFKKKNFVVGLVKIMRNAQFQFKCNLIAFCFVVFYILYFNVCCLFVTCNFASFLCVKDCCYEILFNSPNYVLF